MRTSNLWAILLLVACGTSDPEDPPPSSPATVVEDTGDPATPAASPPPQELANPDEPGPFSFQVASAMAPLPTGELPVQLFLPSTTDAPVIVLLHGFQLGPGDYDAYAERLASWGYVVVAPQLPGSALAPVSHADLGSVVVDLLDWIDGSPAPSHPLHGTATPDTLGLAGHSMGGKIAALVATQDPRPDALFLIDPVDAAPPFGADPIEYPSVTPERMGDLDLPAVFLGETVNNTGGIFGPACAPSEENFRQYFEHAIAPALEIEVLGAGHMDFLDDPNCGLICAVCPSGSAPAGRTRGLTNRYMTAFFEAELRGQEGYLDALTGDAMQSDIDAGWVATRLANGF